jgi:RNA polymerase sigma factor (sigma-70 family)
MKKEWVLTQETFDKLLAWLDTDRDEAGKKYENIRRRLIKIFSCRGCGEPEDLTDETINRVAKKVEELAATYSGDPALYFYGVAQKLYLEYFRRKRHTPPPPVVVVEESEETKQEYDCLERCMEQLTTKNRELVLQYYREDKQAKIEHHKSMAQQLGIGLNALRIRAYRVRATLQECVQECLGR